MAVQMTPHDAWRPGAPRLSDVGSKHARTRRRQHRLAAGLLPEAAEQQWGADASGTRMGAVPQSSPHISPGISLYLFGPTGEI